MPRLRLLRGVLPWLTLLGSSKALAQPAYDPPVLVHAERLSHTLRARRLRREERAEILRRNAVGEPDAAIYTGYLDRWLTKDFLLTALGPLAFLSGHPPEDPAGVFLPLSRAKVRSSFVYFLPQTIPAGAPANEPPCGDDDVVEVRPWWAIHQKIKLCSASYRPEHTFDAIGYCAGQPEPRLPTPPRAGCGCGPAALACFPPKDVMPELAGHLRDDTAAEVIETVKDLIITREQPTDTLLTTSRTWQTGLVEFMYLRRELIAELFRAPYSEDQEEKIVQRIQQLDLSRPGRWVEREGIYANSGLYWSTLAPSFSLATHRVMARNTFETLLCTEFNSVHVDSEVLLKAVGTQHRNLRGLQAIVNSPMRTQPGCKGCHAPMDNTAGFLLGLQTALFGSSPTTVSPGGRLFVNGASDYRGEGVGYASLARLIVKQPEYAECFVKKIFGALRGRDPLNSEHPLVMKMTRDFERSHHSFLPLVREILATEVEGGQGAR
jgi:hypothetical protein